MIKKYAFAITLIIILFEPSKGQKVEKQLIKAEQAYNSRRDSSVINYCNYVLLKEPENEKASILRAKSYIRNKELDSANMALKTVTHITKRDQT